MRSKWWLVAGTLLAARLPALAQQPGGSPLPRAQLLKSRRANELVFNDYQGSGFNFRLALDPKADVRAAATPGEYLVNGWTLGIKAATATPDTAALRRFVASEEHRLLGSQPGLRAYFHPVVRQFTDQATGRRCIIWGFEMPEALDKSLDGVYYLYFQDGSHLLSLSGTQPKGQPARATLDVLFAALRGYSSSAQPYPTR